MITLNKLRQGSWTILGLVAFWQCTFFPGMANLSAIVYVVIAWIFITGIFLKSEVLNNYPLSAFLVVGYGSTQFYFPLLFTTLEGKPLIYNLEVPHLVFLHSLLILMVLIIMHALYRQFSYERVIKPGRGARFWRKLCLFETPSNAQVWLIGLIGLAAMFVTSFLLKSGDDEGGNTGGKILEGFLPFTYAPFFIPFGQLYGQYKTKPKGIIGQLILFTLILFVVSIGKNSRGAFMIGFASLGFAFILGTLLDLIRIRLFTFKYALLGAGVIWLLSGPIAELGTAMVIVRHQRDNIPKAEFIRLTWDVYQDKKTIHAFEALVKSEGKQSDWDEKYLDNIFLARFCNIKFNDICLSLVSQMENDGNVVKRYAIDRMWATFPQPVLNVLQPNVDKLKVNSMSFGDLLRYQVSKSEYVLGSFVTGNLAGTGMAAFGWWYLLILAVAILPVYILFDLLQVCNYVSFSRNPEGFMITRRFSLCALLNMMVIFQFLPTESVTDNIQYLMRGYWQMLLLYFVLFQLTRWITKPFK